MSAADTAAKSHYFVPQPSHWPITGSFALLLMGAGAAFWMNSVAAGPWMLLAGFCVLLVMLFGWFGAVIGESEGHRYNSQVDMSFRWSMGWFIFSEVMFFAAFFGALFYVRNLSVPDLGSLDSKLLWPDYAAAWPTVGPYLQGAVHADGRDRHPAAQHDHPADLGLHADGRAPRAAGREPGQGEAVARRHDRCWASRSSASRPTSTSTRTRRSTSSCRRASTARRSTC